MADAFDNDLLTLDMKLQAIVAGSEPDFFLSDRVATAWHR
jgi:hypothetical protein